MFKKILLATDSSPATRILVSCAGELRKLGSTQALIAQCFMIPELVAFPAEIEARIRLSLEPFAETLNHKGIPTEIIVEAGLPSLEIPRLADQENCSLIVIGSRGHNFTSEIFLGGTAAEILHRASRPLLIIRMNADLNTDQTLHAEKPCDFMRHILFPTDFSNHAEYAFEYLLEIAAQGAKQITLLHTQDMTRLKKHLEPRLDEFDAIDRQRLNVLKTRLEAVSHSAISVKLCHGSPIEEILKEDQQASLIVMGTHGRGYINELFMGSVSHNTARHSSAPVFLIPKPFKNNRAL